MNEKFNNDVRDHWSEKYGLVRTYKTQHSVVAFYVQIK